MILRHSRRGDRVPRRTGERDIFGGNPVLIDQSRARRPHVGARIDLAQNHLA